MTEALKDSGWSDRSDAKTVPLRSFGIIAALFFCSGAVGLLYEVAWFRRLQLVFGVSVFAIGAVVTAFMFGLAGGSRWAAAAPVMRRNPLRVYAVLEAIVGVYAFVFPWLVVVIERTYSAVSAGLEGEFLVVTALRFALSLMLLLPPTFCMGATLPALAAALPDQRELARRVGWLYSVNMFGGVGGTLFAGFYALEHFGIRRTIWIGAAVNVAVAGAAWVLSRHCTTDANCRDVAKAARGTGDAAEAEQSHNENRAGSFRPALLVVALTGLISMAMEIVWTRGLVFYVHNSTYAFSAILAIYLIGLATGAAAGARLSNRADFARWLSGALVALGFAGLLAIAAYRAAPALLQPVLGGTLAPELAGLPDRSARMIQSWSTALFSIFTQAGVVLLLPAFLFGLVFPLALRLADDGVRGTATVGKLYAANTVGSVLGTLLGSFVLVPLLGTRGALLFLTWLPVLPAALLLSKERLTPKRAGICVVCVGAMIVLSLAAAPAGFYRQMFQQRFGKVLWFSEGVAETVAICEHTDKSAWIHYSDGRGASGTTSFRGGWLYAHIPLLLHPNPKSALVICFGTGNTLGAARLHPLDRVDGVELSSEVVKASEFFKESNHDVAHNPHVRVVIEDGRNYLLAARNRYDVITEEPPLVHTAGVVNLYSKDFYQLCSERLTPTGIMAVWLATWEMEESDVKMLVRAFTEAFSYASAWDSKHLGEWILIGSKQPLAVDPERLRQRMADPVLAGDLAKIGIHAPADFLALYLKGEDYLHRFTQGVAPVTDDRSVVDYTIAREARANFGLGDSLTSGLNLTAAGPAGLISELRFRNFDGIYAARDSAESLLQQQHAGDSLRTEMAARRSELELEAGRKLAWNVRAAASDYVHLGDPAKAVDVLERGARIAGRISGADLLVTKAELCYRTGRIPEAQDALGRALAIIPDHQQALDVRKRLDR